MEQQESQAIYIPVNQMKEHIQISQEEFLKRFPYERRYIEYLMQQGNWELNKINGNEITEIEFLKLAQFIYDEPERDSIPLHDLGLKIYNLVAKIEYGIRTSQIACKEIEECNQQIPCTPYPEKVFWAKLKGVKPLQFLEPAFDATVSVEDVIKFSTEKRRQVNRVWDVYKPLLTKYAQSFDSFSTSAKTSTQNEIDGEPINLNSKSSDRWKEFDAIMNKDAAMQFALIEEELTLLKYVEKWKVGKDKKGISTLIHHLNSKNYFAKLGTAYKPKMTKIREFFKDRYGIDLTDSLRQHKKTSQDNFKDKVPYLR